MKKPNPPLIDLGAYWPYQVVVLADIISRHTRELLKQHSDLNLSQWRVLAAIGEQPGRTSRDVVAITPMDKGIVSRAVATLIKSGLVEKINDPQDRRRSTLKLTAPGYRQYQTIAKALDRALRNIPAETAGGHDFSTVLKDYTRRMSDL